MIPLVWSRLHQLHTLWLVSVAPRHGTAELRNSGPWAIGDQLSISMAYETEEKR